MALTLSALGSVTALNIFDSACVESDGTYDLIFTGSNTTPATGTYAILGNVITAVNLTSGGTGYAAAPTVATQTGDGSVTATFVSFATSQDLQSRHPLVEIISAQATADIPFDGSYLTSESINENNPASITHSSGRLLTAYSYGPYDEVGLDFYYDIKYTYTNIDRTEFNSTSFILPVRGVIDEISICELADGNVGIIYLYHIATTYYLRYKTLSVTGTQIADGAIANWSTTIYTTGPNVIKLADDSYLMVYCKISGADYKFYKRTSSDFITWGAETEISVGGLTSTNKVYQPYLAQISNGDIWLWFAYVDSVGPNGEELINLYYSVSANNGSTWANAVKVTNFTTYSEVGKHPVAVQKAANTMHIIFDKIMPSLHMDHDSTGWDGPDFRPVDLHFDSTNRKLYFVGISVSLGDLRGVAKIDVDTWEIDNFWDTGTTPGFPSAFDDNNIRQSLYHRGDGPYLAIANYDGLFYSVLNGETNSITNYYFKDYPAYGITKNVDFTTLSGTYKNQPGPSWIDSSANRLYICIYVSTGTSKLAIGYIDLTESLPSGGLYTWNEIVRESGTISSSEASYLYYRANLVVASDEDLIMLNCSFGSTGGKGMLRIWTLSDGGVYKYYRFDDYAGFPYYGLEYSYFYNGKVYGGLSKYQSLYGEDTKRGLWEVTLATDAMRTIRPTWATVDNYLINEIVAGETNELIISSWGYGISIFNLIDETWTLFDNDTVPGLTPSAVENFNFVDYDATNGLIFSGLNSFPTWTGVIMFSRYGYLQQASYFTGANSGGWTFGDDDPLVQGYNDFNAVVALDPDDQSMYCFWVEQDETECSIKWDKENSSMDISAYLVDEISTEHTIDGTPASLSFSISSGHLFDPYNLSSLMSPVLKKGRKLTLRWGEEIADINNWQNAGTYYITEGSLTLARGTYPVMKVKAEDQRTLWSHSHIYATEIYTDSDPDKIIEDVLEDFTGLESGDLNLPTFAGGKALQMQWIETTLDDILNQVCERFGYYFRFDVDGKAHAKLISNVASVDHIYSDNTKLLEYTPDDKYSDFTNRVTVQGQELDFTQVTYNEERISQVSGTCGWWGCKKDHKVWYSDDKSRRAVNPRLEVLETSTSIPFKLAGKVKEWIEECSSAGDDKYCTVYVEAPSLIGLLAAAIAVIAMGYKIGDIVPSTGGMTHTVGRRIEGAGVVSALMILGSVVNYQLAVWAQPLGNVRRSVQATANDTEHQTEINAIVEQKISDPLCYTVADCLMVATFELMVAQMQRRRVKIKKVAHLQDEDGDTIQVVHPYSEQTMKLFIASLKRTFKKADADSNDGGFFDVIEGWFCE